MHPLEIAEEPQEARKEQALLKKARAHPHPPSVPLSSNCALNITHQWLLLSLWDSGPPGRVVVQWACLCSSESTKRVFIEKATR